MGQIRLSHQQKEEIVQRLDAGDNKNVIANTMGINWKQVDYWSKNKARVAQLAEAMDLKSIECRFESDHGYHYAYLLGAYLGDGYINKCKYTWKLRFACDMKYVSIIEELKTSLLGVGLSPGTWAVSAAACVTVYAHASWLPMAFPQHGIGPKHDRAIILEDWQQRIIQQHPQSFLRGLYHTDGSRYIHKQRGYECVKYNFTNRSKDIVDLFCSTCDNLSVGYTVSKRPFKNSRNEINYGWTVTIGRKSEVEKCEVFLGSKADLSRSDA